MKFENIYNLKRRINLNFLLAYNYYIDDKWRYYEYR